MSAATPEEQAKIDAANATLQAAQPAPADNQGPLVGDSATPASGPGDFPSLLRRAMDELGMASRALRAGTAAICFGESGFMPRHETSYAGTAAARIREVFGSRVASMSDEQIDALKADDEAFWRQVRPDWVWGVSSAPFDGTSARRHNAAYRRHCVRRGVTP